MSIEDHPGYLGCRERERDESGSIRYQKRAVIHKERNHSQIIGANMVWNWKINSFKNFSNQKKSLVAT